MLDGDATSITKRLQSAQRKDKKKISRLGGVERAFHGKSSGPGFEGKTAKVSSHHIFPLPDTAPETDEKRPPSFALRNGRTLI